MITYNSCTYLLLLLLLHQPLVMSNSIVKYG